MSNMDPVSDLLMRIRNAHLAKHDRVDVPSSKLKAEICKILRDEGFIKNYRLVEQQPFPMIRVFLEYDESGEPAITHAKRVSKPGRRVYASVKNIPRVANGLGVSILSTPKGVMSDSDARDQNVGGEVLCRIF